MIYNHYFFDLLDAAGAGGNGNEERVAEAERLLATGDQATDALKGQIAAGQVGAAAEGFSKALDAVTQVEELTALTYTVPAPPAEFANLPYLKGRATVDMVLKRDGAQFDVEGKLYDKARLSLLPFAILPSFLSLQQFRCYMRTMVHQDFFAFWVPSLLNFVECG